MKNNWEMKKIGDVCSIVNGGTPDTTVPEFWDGENLWITPKDMGKLDSIYVDDTSRKITSAGLKNSSAKLLPVNSIILSSRAPIGHLAINKKLVSTNQGCKGLIPKKDISSLYVFYFLKKSVELLNKLGSGATFKELSSSKLAEVEIPIPPIAEQQRIIAILDEAFAAIAQAKENAEKNLQNARELFDSYLQSVFANPHDGWEIKTLNQISENLDSKRIPITKNVRTSGSIPYYGASGIVDYVEDYIFDDDLLLVSEDGANLLARTYPIAFSISGKTWVNNHAHVLRFENIESQKFVELYLNSIKLDDYVSGMAQPKLNQAMLNKIPIPYPPIEEQKTIVSKLSAISAETKKLENIYRQKINDLDELKKSILQKAFNGELTANNRVSNVIEFPVRIPNISATDLQAGIVALAFQRHQESGKVLAFGHVKAEKIVHLAQELLNVELDREPVKDAAGPNDFPQLKKVESRAEKAGFFRTVKQGYGGYTYIQGNQFDNLIEKTKTALNDKADELTDLIDLLVPMDTQQVELVATVYAAWNNLLFDNQTINNEAIVFEARENWHEAKLNIPRERFFKTIDWMRENNLIPNGKGKKVSPRPKK